MPNQKSLRPNFQAVTLQSIQDSIPAPSDLIYKCSKLLMRNCIPHLLVKDLQSLLPAAGAGLYSIPIDKGISDNYYSGK